MLLGKESQNERKEESGYADNIWVTKQSHVYELMFVPPLCRKVQAKGNLRIAGDRNQDGVFER